MMLLHCCSVPLPPSPDDSTGTMLTLLLGLIRPRRGRILPSMAAETAPLRAPKDVLDFWFGGRSHLGDRDFLQARMKLWFGGGPEFEQVQRDNKELMDAALRNELDDDTWRTSSGLLAQIILTDQFPRVVYRATAQAFSGEAVALAAAHKLVESGWFVSELLPAERMFATLPLIHSESLADHELLDSLIQVMIDNCPENLVSLFPAFGLDQLADSLRPREHIAILDRSRLYLQALVDGHFQLLQARRASGPLVKHRIRGSTANP